MEGKAYDPFRRYFNLTTDDDEDQPLSPDCPRINHGSFYTTPSQLPKPVLGRGSGQSVEAGCAVKGQDLSQQNGYSTAFYNQIVSSAFDSTSDLLDDPNQVAAEMFQELLPSRHSSGSDLITDLDQESLPASFSITSYSEQLHQISLGSRSSQSLVSSSWQNGGYPQQITDVSRFGSSDLSEQKSNYLNRSSPGNFDQDITSVFDSMMTLKDETDRSGAGYQPSSRRSSDSTTLDSDPEIPQSVPWNTPTGSFSTLYQLDQRVQGNSTTRLPENRNGSSGLFLNTGTYGSHSGVNSAVGSPSRGSGMSRSPARSNGYFGLPSRSNSAFESASSGHSGEIYPVYSNGEDSFNVSSSVSGDWIDGPLNGLALGSGLTLANVQQLLLLLQACQAHTTNAGNRNDYSRNYSHQLEEGKFCAFCKKNRETPEFYRTHVVKDSRGNVICPVLRKYTCPVCQATGDKAHTLRHCPVRFQNTQLEQRLSWCQGNIN